MASTGFAQNPSLPEKNLLDQLQGGLAEFNDWQRTVLRMRQGLTAFYGGGGHCG
jgi:spore cortex formation protein SpoVR/YcgB (stage V sporulation)